MSINYSDIIGYIKINIFNKMLLKNNSLINFLPIQQKLNMHMFFLAFTCFLSFFNSKLFFYKFI